jgi:hypothetical protein
VGKVEREMKNNNNMQNVPEPEPITSYFTQSIDGGYSIAVHVLPIPHYPWDNPDYVPIAFLVQKIKPTVLREFHDFADSVHKDVKKNTIICVLLGLAGLLIVLSILAGMSNVLTHNKSCKESDQQRVVGVLLAYLLAASSIVRLKMSISTKMMVTKRLMRKRMLKLLPLPAPWPTLITTMMKAKEKMTNLSILIILSKS